jgi:hypothetical protein
LSRPGGNTTGIYFFVADLVAKRLGLLRELVPGAAWVAVLVNPVAAARAESTVKAAEAAAGALGLQVQIFNVGTRHDASAPPHCSSTPIRFSPTGESNSPTWRRATRFPPYVCRATFFLKSVR